MNVVNVNRMILQLKAAQKSSLQGLPNGTIHLIIDIWTSLQHKSVLGIKAQFLTKDWSMQQMVLGFLHFPVSHTGEEIQNKLTDFLATDYGLSLMQVIGDVENKITFTNRGWSFPVL